ncbi:hypothetical protein M404DRAFT_152851, partial [Pisolithus tinctorius Marx 270]
WNINQEELQAILKGASCLAPPASKCPPHKPFQVETLELFHSLMNLKDPKDAAIFMYMTTVFYCVARLREFSALNQTFQPHKTHHQGRHPASTQP